MNTHFLNIDINAVTFDGLSLSSQRKFALVASILVWAGVSASILYSASLLDSEGLAAKFILTAICLSILDCILTGRFIPLRWTKLIVQYMPISVLYQNDIGVLTKARAEIYAVANQVHFEDYLIYAKINPHIRSEESIRVMMAQRKGNLEEWAEKPKNLKALANLVYQIHLVEKFIEQDADRF